MEAGGKDLLDSIKYRIVRIFLKIRKFKKKVLTFAGGSVIITKLSARATAHEFF